MKIEADKPEEYISKVPEERKEPMKRLWDIFKENLPEGFEEYINYNMPSFVVPHSIYPDGYHVDSDIPLPFVSIASQKNHISLYHYGIYADEKLMKWFKEEYKKRLDTKPDMGKSCIRFNNVKKIPYDLIEELAGKMTVDEWIELYEEKMNR